MADPMLHHKPKKNRLSLAEAEDEWPKPLFLLAAHNMQWGDVASCNCLTPALTVQNTLTSRRALNRSKKDSDKLLPANQSMNHQSIFNVLGTNWGPTDKSSVQ